MMHYLAAYISRKRPEAAAFVHDLEFARSLSQVNSPASRFCTVFVF
jgi:hypothetical protein